MTLSEKVAYLKGLKEGLALNDSRPETKLFDAIIDTLDEMASSTETLEGALVELTDQVDEIDLDLGSLEETVLMGDEDWDEDEYEVPFADLPEDDDSDDDDFDFDPDEDMYEVQCPSCHEVIYVDAGILEEGGIECPNCGEKLAFELEED